MLFVTPACCDPGSGEVLDSLLYGGDVEDSQEHLALAKKEDCIVVLGGTGAGKSTLLNAICQGPGNMVEVDEKDKEISYSKDKQAITYLKPKNSLKRNGKILFQSGGGRRSVTQYPEVYEWQSKVLCDCPGFNDKGGVAKDLVHSVSIGTLLKRAARVKLCFVIPEKHFVAKGDRQGVLEDMLHTLYALLKAGADFESNLAKVQIVVSCPSGQLKKQYIVEKLGEILREKLPVKQGVIDAILSNLMFVDAADRSYVFVDEEEGWFSSSSPSQDSVGALVDRLLAEDDWILPHDFNYPLTEKALQALQLLIKDIHVKATDLLLADGKTKEIDRLEKILHQLDNYKFPGLDVSHYLSTLCKYRSLKKENAHLKEMLEITTEMLESAKKVTFRAYESAKKKGFWKTIGGLLGI